MDDDALQVARFWNEESKSGSLEPNEALRLADIDGCKHESKQAMAAYFQIKGRTSNGRDQEHAGQD